jgi:uncharacterized protein YlxW (UPF0749 family)
MRVRRNQWTIAAVAFVLGLLVVVQLRAQAGTTGLEQLSTQDLTVLVANVNARNDQLRNEVATLERELGALKSGQARGAQSVDQIRMDLRRVRAYAGLDPVTGPGVTITVSGPIDGPALEALANELRNAGAEAIAVAGVRLVPGVVMTGEPGGVTVDGMPVDDSFDIEAIGAQEQLTGSLTRSGGIIAQLAATQEQVVLTVTPLDRLDLPATDHPLVPVNGHPRL